MKKIILLTVLCFLAVSCSYTPAPNPGFRVSTEIEIKQGLPPFTAYIPAPRSGTVTNGFYRIPSIGTQTGTEIEFYRKVSNSLGFFDVNNGKAPATWYFEAFSGWRVGIVDCNNRGIFIEAHPGRTILLTCGLVGGFQFPLSPSVIDINDNNPVELQGFINDVDANSGMPLFHFEDYTGTVIGSDTALSVNGNDVSKF